MRLRTFLKPLSFLPAILVMYMIYSFSAQEADVSSRLSHTAGVKIVTAADYILDTNLEPWQIEDYADRIEGVTRKLAHMGEYFLLAVSVSFPLYVYGLHGILLMLVAGLICVGYAVGDEYHQSFVYGRSAQLRDVGIDSAGALIGIILVRIIGFTGRHTLFRPTKKEKEASRREMRALLREQERLQDELREREAREEYYRRKATRLAEKERRKNPTADTPDNSTYQRRDTADDYQDEYRDTDRYYTNPDHDDDRYYDSADFYEAAPTDTSDELSEDMPLSKLLRRRDMRR